MRCKNPCCNILKIKKCEKNKDISMIQQAINHYEHGVKYDIFSEPVTTYAKLAIEALKEKLEILEGK